MRERMMGHPPGSGYRLQATGFSLEPVARSLQPECAGHLTVAGNRVYYAQPECDIGRMSVDILGRF